MGPGLLDCCSHCGQESTHAADCPIIMRLELAGRKIQQKARANMWRASSNAVPGGSTPSQYALPEGATELQDLIEYREMTHAVATIFEACYRTGHCAHSDELRNMHKVRWFADREIARLMRLEELCE